MILLHIITENHDTAIEISDFLVEQRLIVNAVIMEKIEVRERGPDGQIDSRQKILIMGKTKGLLFPTIDEEIRLRFGDKMPVLYSIPIVSMDWEQASDLVKKTTKV